jgi:hypothetical protein
MAVYYSNVTLTSQGGDLTAVVYLPRGLKDQEDTFYYGSRFDHSSMIGSITRKQRDPDGKVKDHVLYGTDMWRTPHNSHWPESGVGLAAEFGVGDNGAFCFYRCGWSQASDVTNGVLGYVEARNGEPFLKIGVGALVKGTCPTCDVAGEYNFNSPYLVHEAPKWKMEAVGQSAIRMEHEARLNEYGYHLVKEISLLDDTLFVTMTLTNLGAQAFSTAWYSHNFFSCDGNAIGPGYSIEMNLKGDNEPIYDEPATWSWATPLLDYARLVKRPQSILIEMVKALNPGVRIKAEFVDDGETSGSFKIEACGSTISSSIPQMEEIRRNPQNGQQDLSMYAYNLYIERGTLSPEPQLLLNLKPGVPVTWTQRLVIGGARPNAVSTWSSLRAGEAFRGFHSKFSTEGLAGVYCLMVAGVLLSLIVMKRTWIRNRRRQYHTILDTSS